MIRVLFVCTGNICRSPTAEGIFWRLVEEAGLKEQFFVDSAGTSPGRINCAPDSRSQAECRANGVDISSQRSREVTSFDTKEFDYILAMTDEHFSYLASLAPVGMKHKVLHFMKFVAGARNLDVPDPYIGEDGFKNVYATIARGAEGLLGHIRSERRI